MCPPICGGRSAEAVPALGPSFWLRVSVSVCLCVSVSVSVCLCVGVLRVRPESGTAARRRPGPWLIDLLPPSLYGCGGGVGRVMAPCDV